MTWNMNQHGERSAIIEALRTPIATDNPAEAAQAARAATFVISELERSTRPNATIHMGGAASGGDHYVSITIDHPVPGWTVKRTTRKARTRRDAEGVHRPTETRSTLLLELAPQESPRVARSRCQSRAMAFAVEELASSSYLHASVIAQGDEGTGGVTVSVSTAE